jgi:hypothetical protein
MKNRQIDAARVTCDKTHAIQGHVPTYRRTNQAVLEEMDEQLFTAYDFCYFVVVRSQMRVLRHSSPIYLTNFGTLKFSGTIKSNTKHISMALTGS